MKNLIAEVNGIRICYDIYGEGFPIILIHGFGAKKEIWIAQVGVLSNHYQVIAFDLRGSGKSDRPDQPYTMELFADDIKGLMDYLKIKKAHVIGRSLGGMIAQNFIIKYPNSVGKLVLMTTNAYTDREGAEIIKQSGLEGLKKFKLDPEKAFWEDALILFHRDFRKKMEANPKEKFFNFWSVEDLIEQNKIDPQRPQDIINRANTIVNHNTLDKLSQLQHEVLLIAASHDRLTPKSSMIEMHEKIPNSKLNIFENTGHFVNLSHANEVNKLILDFLDS